MINAIIPASGAISTALAVAFLPIIGWLAIVLNAMYLVLPFNSLYRMNYRSIRGLESQEINGFDKYDYCLAKHIVMYIRWVLLFLVSVFFVNYVLSTLGATAWHFYLLASIGLCIIYDIICNVKKSIGNAFIAYDDKIIRLIIPKISILYKLSKFNKKIF